MHLCFPFFFFFLWTVDGFLEVVGKCGERLKKRGICRKDPRLGCREMMGVKQVMMGHYQDISANKDGGKDGG